LLKDAEARNSLEMTRLLVARGHPDKDSEQTYQTYRLSQLGLQRSQVGKLLDELMPSLTRSSGEDRRRYRECLRGIVYALGVAGYAFEWLVLPMQDKHYSANARLGKLGLSRRRVERVLCALEEAGLMLRGRKGYRDPRPNHQSKASQFYPSPKLMEYFASCLYEFEDPFDVEVYRYNDFPREAIPLSEDVAEGVDLLTRYNDFMRQFSWARKGPTHRTFSGSMTRGGRLINGYQNIVKHRVPIRPNTLIDGYPIAEPDFSANHLRMAAALVGEELPEDPYSEVSKVSGGSRDAVKAFVTVALGITSPRQIGGAMKTLRESHRTPISTPLFRELRDAFPKLYSWIAKHDVFFNDTGARLQLYEGNIAMQLAGEAIRAERPVLAVHDAFAVRAQDAPWISALMRETWKRELKTTIEPVISTGQHFR